MLKVLIVEDEDVIRKEIICMVDWTSLDCIIAGEANNGAKGVELVRRIRPDIVITDVKMPLMNGIDMLSETIKEADYEAIIVSGDENFSYAKTAISLGVSEYLLKPLAVEAINAVLIKVVKKVKEKKKMQQIKFGVIKDCHRILDIESIEAAIPVSASYAKAMVNFIKGNYHQKISVNDLSRKLMISTTSLNKKFKDATEYTFNEFLNRYRIQQAVNLLLTTDKKIYQIAEETGFTEYKYFLQVFKKYVGYAPMEFIAKNIKSKLYL